MGASGADLEPLCTNYGAQLLLRMTENDQRFDLEKDAQEMTEHSGCFRLHSSHHLPNGGNHPEVRPDVSRTLRSIQ